MPTLNDSGTTMSGLWMFMQPTLALNYYGNGVNLERIVPTGPHTTEIRYTFLFHKDADWAEVSESMETSFIVTNEGKYIGIV